MNSRAIIQLPIRHSSFVQHEKNGNKMGMDIRYLESSRNTRVQFKLGEKFSISLSQVWYTPTKLANYNALNMKPILRSIYLNIHVIRFPFKKSQIRKYIITTARQRCFNDMPLPRCRKTTHDTNSVESTVSCLSSYC